MLFLAPSKVHGIGVFTNSRILRGAKLPVFAKDDYRRRSKVSRLEARYSIKDGKYWHGPKDFHQMSIGWYLNHAKEPNCFHENYVYFTNRTIRKGEELTIDYRTL